MTLVRIEPADPGLCEALRAADLPTSDLTEGGAQYFSFDGLYGGLVQHGDVGLLRSMVVPADRRGSGAGGELLACLVEHARAASVRDLWLLTTSAEKFFSRHGFARVERDQAPAAIANTSQFRDLCPASAALMHKQIA